MTKQQLQQELLEKVKPGTKPSHLKKLKKSKSADDIPTSTLEPIPIERSKSAEPSSSISKIKELEQENQELKKQLEQTGLALAELTKIKSNPPTQLLQDQLKEKQKQIEELRKQKEELIKQLTETTTELDNSLIARYEALKTFSKVQEQLKQVKQELDNNVDEASTELINQDETITKLRNKQQKAQIKIRELEKDLNLSQRLAELRKSNYPEPHYNLPLLKLALYGLVALIFTLWLLPKEKYYER